MEYELLSRMYDWILVRYCPLVIPGEDVEAEEEEEEEEEQKGPDLKQASRRDMYSICQAAGLGVWLGWMSEFIFFYYYFFFRYADTLGSIMPRDVQKALKNLILCNFMGTLIFQRQIVLYRKVTTRDVFRGKCMLYVK